MGSHSASQPGRSSEGLSFLCDSAKQPELCPGEFAHVCTGRLALALHTSVTHNSNPSGHRLVHGASSPGPWKNGMLLHAAAWRTSDTLCEWESLVTKPHMLFHLCEGPGGCRQEWSRDRQWLLRNRVFLQRLCQSPVTAGVTAQSKCKLGCTACGFYLLTLVLTQLLRAKSGSKTNHRSHPRGQVRKYRNN